MYVYIHAHIYLPNLPSCALGSYDWMQKVLYSHIVHDCSPLSAASVAIEKKNTTIKFCKPPVGPCFGPIVD